MKKAVWKMLPVESFDMQGLEEWLSAMEREVLRNGAGTNMDNYSAIAVMI